MLGAAGAGKAFSVSSDIFKAVLAAAGQAAWQRSVNPTQPAVLGAKPWCREGSSPTVAFIRTSRASSALPACWGLDQEEGRLNKAFFWSFFFPVMFTVGVSRFSGALDGQELPGFIVFISVNLLPVFPVLL